VYFYQLIWLSKYAEYTKRKNLSLDAVESLARLLGILDMNSLTGGDLIERQTRWPINPQKRVKNNNKPSKFNNFREKYRKIYAYSISITIIIKFQHIEVLEGTKDVICYGNLICFFDLDQTVNGNALLVKI
jgi:hypothetical protein